MPGAITTGPSSNTAQQLSTAPPHMHQQRQPPAGHTGYAKGHTQMHVPQAVPRLQQLNVQLSTLPSQPSTLMIFKLAALHTWIIWVSMNKTITVDYYRTPFFWQLGRHDRLGNIASRHFKSGNFQLNICLTFANFCLTVDRLT